jgi:hypothetical protein
MLRKASCFVSGRDLEAVLLFEGGHVDFPFPCGFVEIVNASIHSLYLTQTRSGMFGGE